MKYQNQELRDALAAEYALGTLQGRARRRFERSLKDDPRLRQTVTLWQERLAPLDALVEPIEPPARVWRAIQARVERDAGRRVAAQPRGFWASLGLWRGIALASTAAAFALAVSLTVSTMKPGPTETMVVVMQDAQATPAITVSWPTAQRGATTLRVQVVGHPQMASGTSWELWMLPSADQKPVSLGLIGTEPTQELSIPAQLAPTINGALGLAMSVEPKGGSPTGQPTGPVIYKGLRVKL